MKRDDTGYFKKNLILRAILPERVQNGFRKMWNEAKNPNDRKQGNPMEQSLKKYISADRTPMIKT